MTHDPQKVLFAKPLLHLTVCGSVVSPGPSLTNIYLCLVDMIQMLNYGILEVLKHLCIIYKDMKARFYLLIGRIINI